jgi:hypothetical protein
MADLDKLPVDPLLNDTIVAFESHERLSLETRAAIAHTAVILVDEALSDLSDLGKLRHQDKIDWDGLRTTQWLPVRWKLVATKGFVENWAVAVVGVAHGLAQEGWEGPACVGEELALHAVCEYALTLPDFYDLDGDKLQEGIDLFTDMAFQDTDFQYLFEPATDGIDESEIGERLGLTSLNFADTFRPFQNRIGHPFHVAEFDGTQ